MRQLLSRLVGEGTGVRELEGLKVIPHIGGNMGRWRGIESFYFRDQEGSWRKIFGRRRFVGGRCCGRDSRLSGILTGAVASGRKNILRPSTYTLTELWRRGCSRTEDC